MVNQSITADKWDIETNYGYGWETENSEYTRTDARRSLREYRENMEACGTCLVRMVKRREKVA